MAKHGITETTSYDSPGMLVYVAKNFGEIPMGSVRVSSVQFCYDDVNAP